MPCKRGILLWPMAHYAKQGVPPAIAGGVRRVKHAVDAAYSSRTSTHAPIFGLRRSEGKHHMKRSYLVVLALVLGLGFGPAYGQDEATPKRADIKKLLGITGASNTGLRVFSQVIGMFQRAHSDVPEAVWIEMVSGAEAKVDAFVMEMLVPIYDKHLTHADIKELIAFYEDMGPGIRPHRAGKARRKGL